MHASAFSSASAPAAKTFWREARALQSVTARLAALTKIAVTGVGRGTLWLLLVTAFGTVEAIVHMAEFAAKHVARLKRRSS